MLKGILEFGKSLSNKKQADDSPTAFSLANFITSNPRKPLTSSNRMSSHSDEITDAQAYHSRNMETHEPKKQQTTNEQIIDMKHSNNDL